MTLRHILDYLPNSIERACIKVDVEYCNVPIDGKPHEVSLVGDKSGLKQGCILRAVGGVCGQVLNKKTGQGILFISLPEAVL